MVFLFMIYLPQAKYIYIGMQYLSIQTTLRLKSSLENFCITGCSEINQNELINYDIGIYLGNLHQVIVDSLQNLFHFWSGVVQPLGVVG